MAGSDLWTDEWAGDFPLMGAEFSPDINVNFDHSTVSPSEIMVNASSSGSSTGFPSPYLLDSPSEGYDTSPLLSGDDVPGDGPWFTLFPDAVTESEDSGILIKAPPESPQSGDSPDTSPRYRSSSVSSSAKRSSTSGVRKRPVALPPIVVDDPSDVVAVKRARNTLAARKSRAKKAEKMEDMAVTIEELRAEVEHWKRLYHNQVGQ